MDKVYIVHVTIKNNHSIDSIYSTMEKARARAVDLAEYHELEENTEDYTDFWGDDEFNCVAIGTNQVL